MLLTRLLTALITIPLVIIAILWLPITYFSLLIGMMIAIAALEWSKLVGISALIYRIGYVVCVMGGIFLSIFLPIAFILIPALCIWLWAVVAIFKYQKNGNGFGFQFPAVSAWIGWMVLIATWVGIISLRADPKWGASWLILMFMIIWAADVGGYFAGRQWGRRPLALRVSPKKTWAGFVGGLVLSVMVAAIGGLFLSLSPYHYFCLLLLTIVTALFSVVGDLSVSLLKRMSDMKDSGAFFPGHGGVLDRLDSVAAGTVIFVLGVHFLGL